ncbi:MAG: sigma factor-like helix-turn-helix DNA-binding protein [Candidatus Paceibacterota bacterium]|nr:hypothetical protein [Candidatus Nomurabacteria bacterium]
MSKTISFKPKQITKKLMSELQDRAYEVIAGRYGLVDEEKKTLEAIGKKYNITRERVRQIESAALASIRKSDNYKDVASIFEELEEIIQEMGSVVSEDELLESITKDRLTQNHINFYLVLGDNFHKHKEDEHFVARWTVKKDVAEKIHGAVKNLYSSLSEEELLSEPDIMDMFVKELEDVAHDYKDTEIVKRWLCLSKGICPNPLGDWGRASSSSVKTRGIKDYAYLVMRKHGSPMHFKEVAKAIGETFGKKTHTATCHNELIKDSRFVLVGRGMYALKEWGYKKGVVRDVISDILKKKGPMSKEEIIDQVMKERYLKRNTILVNLQNAKYFKKNKNGLYSLAA